MKPPTRSCQPAPSDRQDQAVQDLCARALRGGQQASPTSGCPLRWNKPCSSASRLEFFHQGLWLQGKGCAQGPHTCRLGRSRCRGRPQPTRRAGEPASGTRRGFRSASSERLPPSRRRSDSSSHCLAPNKRRKRARV